MIISLTGEMTQEQFMNIIVRGGKDSRRAKRRIAKRRKDERTARIINVSHGYDDEPEALRKAVYQRINSETTGRRRLEANAVGGALKRQEVDAIDLQETLAS